MVWILKRGGAERRPEHDKAGDDMNNLYLMGVMVLGFLSIAGMLLGQNRSIADLRERMAKIETRLDILFAQLQLAKKHGSEG